MPNKLLFLRCLFFTYSKTWERHSTGNLTNAYSDLHLE
uniref:Uncharacterized protein n=1 Tax=Anguilla anguilla TaxID=7936 RepID=A0A0E9RCC2_ANGAN